MTQYVAMIRGIGPENPAMRGERLRWAFEQMGFTDVRSFLTSGNVLFESDITDTAQLEAVAEETLPRLLGFEREVFIRSQADLQKLADADPFAGLIHQNSGDTYLTVTFFKHKPELGFSLPYQPDGKAFRLLSLHGTTLCAAIDLTKGKTTDYMPWLERTYGKHITTRTWNTVSRLLTKLEN